MIAFLKGMLLTAVFEKTGFLPEVDNLLDWRNELVELKKANTEYPTEWYDVEIEEVDYLLSLHNKTDDEKK